MKFLLSFYTITEKVSKTPYCIYLMFNSRGVSEYTFMGIRNKRLHKILRALSSHVCPSIRM